MSLHGPKLGSLLVGLILSLTVALGAAAQEPAPPPQPAASPAPETIRLTIEVTGGESAAPVENASVYVTYIEEHAVKKNKKTELNVKTNHEGIAHVADAPSGRARIQIVADGWKPYGRWYDLSDPKQIIKIRLEKPPKWY